MINIDSYYNIEMTRGDSLTLELSLTKNNEAYTPEAGDVIRFAMAKTYKDTRGYELLIEKVINHEDMLLRLDPQDTATLNYGKYVYDLQITYADGTVETFANKKQLKLTEEVE